MVAGGHSLIPMMKLRLAQPEMLIDINELTELAGIQSRRASSCGSGALPGTPTCWPRPRSGALSRCCTTPSA